MIIIESIKLAFSSIWANKGRSILTMLGIIIGITSVVTFLAMGEGLKSEIKKTVSDFGTNYIYIIPGNLDIGTSNESSQNQNGGILGMQNAMGNPANFISSDIFKYKDIDEIKKIEGVQYATPMSILSGVIKTGDKTITPMTMGVEPEIEKVFNGFSVSSGKFINKNDLDNKNRVIILSQMMAEKLFDSVENSLGKKIKITASDDEIEYEIIGILSKPNSNSAFSSEMETMALVPYTTVKEDFFKGEDKIFRIGAKGYDNTNTKDIAKKIEDNLLIRHSKEEFSVLTPDDMLGMLDTIMNLLTGFISAIAAISLIVGGVGIMNIMLVAVSERTREIGLRKAVGATNGTILLQFLIEAIVISLFGGLISLGLVEIAVKIIEIKTPLHPIITPYALVLAIGVCLGIGLIFGLIPAIRAARKNPIEALRYE